MTELHIQEWVEVARDFAFSCMRLCDRTATDRYRMTREVTIFLAVSRSVTRCAQ